MHEEKADIRIGTSGWHYKHWRGPFYPPDWPATRMLEFYCKSGFDTVEINNSFYRLPSPAAVRAWREATPPGFCFAVKGSRYLTHMKKLKDPDRGLKVFLPLVETLGEKLGPILFQLPPRWRCHAERLGAFLEALPRTHRYSVELRDPSWHCEEVYRLLRAYNVAFCIYHLSGFQSPLAVTADFTYVRLHGPGEAYQGNYAKALLKVWAERIRRWQRDLTAIYVYFDNDQEAFAVKNARELKAIVMNEER